jgi:hypothetical protein
MGFRRCLAFPYEWFIADERTLRRHRPDEVITPQNCDSVYVDSMIQSHPTCPKCGDSIYARGESAVH